MSDAKVKQGIIESRLWLPSLSVAIFTLFGAAVFFSYQSWNHSQSDSELQQKIRVFTVAKDNFLYYSKKVVTGDASAVSGFNNSFQIMTDSIESLTSADDFTKEQLDQQYDNLFIHWNHLVDNSSAIDDTAYAVRLLNSTIERLNAAVQEAQQTNVDIVNSLLISPTRATAKQLETIGQQVITLQNITKHLTDFVFQEQLNNNSFVAYENQLKQYTQRHEQLINGHDLAGLQAVSKPIAARLMNVSQLLEGIKSASGERNNTNFVGSAARQLLLSRTAHERLSNRANNVTLALNEMSTKIDDFNTLRFPNIYHIGVIIILLFVAIVALMVYQRFLSKRELQHEHQEGQQTQSAILRLLDELVDLADGDLTVTATVSEDFTGAIADSINFTIDQLRQLVSGINTTAVQVSKAAQSTQQTALHLAEASDHQAQEIAGASAAVNEMAVTIDQVSANASESSLVASKSVSIANNGAKLVQNTIDGMDTIREQIQDTSKRIKRLGESSQEIGDIVSLINDIADQTNILALNAAIQASMAGDAGRGFAVVADEVQRLAERSAAATKQIETIVKTIQTDTNEAVISMEQTTSEVVRGARLAQDAGVALEEIEGVSASLAELIQNISNAARQQASSAGHISNTMNVIQEITSQTSTGTSDTARSIGELAHMALNLRESVAGFTLPDDMTETDDDVIDLVDDDDIFEEDLVDEISVELIEDVTTPDDIAIEEIEFDGDLDISEDDVTELDTELDLAAELAQLGLHENDQEDTQFFELLSSDENDEDMDFVDDFDIDFSDMDKDEKDKRN